MFTSVFSNNFKKCAGGNRPPPPLEPRLVRETFGRRTGHGPSAPRTRARVRTERTARLTGRPTDDDDDDDDSRLDRDILFISYRDAFETKKKKDKIWTGPGLRPRRPGLHTHTPAAARIGYTSRRRKTIFFLSAACTTNDGLSSCRRRCTTDGRRPCIKTCVEEKKTILEIKRNKHFVVSERDIVGTTCPFFYLSAPASEYHFTLVYSRKPIICPTYMLYTLYAHMPIVFMLCIYMY